MTEQTESMQQAAFFAALSVHLNAHPHLPELATVGWRKTLQVSQYKGGLAGALDWTRTLGGDLTASISANGDTQTAVVIKGTMAGHPVEIFTVDDDQLHELLPPDEGQPSHERRRSITLSELESYLASTTAPAAEATQAQHGEPVQGPPATAKGAPPEDLEQQFADALGALFVGQLLFELSASDAYDALKHKVLQRCQTTTETPAQVLRSISYADRAFAAEADDPAAFLASRITTD